MDVCKKTWHTNYSHKYALLTQSFFHLEKKSSLCNMNSMSPAYHDNPTDKVIKDFKFHLTCAGLQHGDSLL